MNCFSKVLLGLILIIGIAFPISGVAQAANAIGSPLADDPAPDGQGGIATPTPIRLRMNGSAKAYYITPAPLIDGDWSDWGSPEMPARFVVVGGQHRTNNQDLDASYKLAWDEDALYVGVKVRDDKYVQNARVDQLYKGDSIDILFDSDFFVDFDNKTLNNDDFQVGINPGHGSPSGPKESYVFYPKNLAGPRDDIDIGTKRSSGVTRIEARIPWSTFSITPSAGQKFGFAIGISDNDDPLHDVQQTFVSNIRKRSVANPTTWGDLTLVGGDGEAPIPTVVPTSACIVRTETGTTIQSGATWEKLITGGEMKIYFTRQAAPGNPMTVSIDGAPSGGWPYNSSNSSPLEVTTGFDKTTHTLTIVNGPGAPLVIEKVVSFVADQTCW